MTSPILYPISWNAGTSVGAAGATPAENAATLPSPSRFAQPSAICERQEFPVQTKRMRISGRASTAIC